MKYIFFFVLFVLMPVYLFSQANQLWETEHNGTGDYTDRFVALASDGSGNTYLAGSTMNPDRNSDFLVIKTSADGSELWRVILNAPGNGPDNAKTIAVHNNTVYASGYGNNISVGSDFYTVAINASTGDTLWTRLYNDSAFNQYDEANSIAIDNDGNIIVTGESDRDVSGAVNHDFLTVKYSPEGSLQWAVRFNDIGDATDRAAKVLTDNLGNIYIGGRSNNGADDDYCLIKYNAAGAQQWIEFHDNGGTDRATDMGMDQNFNVYITGRSNNGNDDDFYTIKYSPAGTLLLTAIFDFVEDDRAEAIFVTPTGEFAVTGRSDALATAAVNYNYYTVKYSSNGTQEWASTFAGTAGGDDWPMDVAISASGSVAVTGMSDSAAGTAISNDAVTVLYQNTGTTIWTRSEGLQGLEDRAYALLFFNENVIVAGEKATAINAVNAIRIRYTNAGVASEYTYNGAGDNGDNVRDGVSDAEGNLYICGYSVGTDSDRDFFVAKLTTAGDTLWTRSYTGTMYGSDDDATAIALDNAGNVVVTGYIKNSGTGSDIAIYKFSPDGSLLWQQVYNGVTGESDRAHGLLIDASNTIYVTGRTDVDPSYTNNDDILTLKYSSAGVLLWARIASTGPGSDRGDFLLPAPTGVFVAGRGTNTIDNDVVLLRYTESGTLVWSESFNLNQDEFVRDIQLTNDDQLLLAVSAYNVSDALPVAAHLVRYDANGALVSNTQVNTSFDQEEAVALSMASTGDFYLLLTGDNEQRVITQKYAASGSLLWETTESLGDATIGDDILVVDNDDVIVAFHTDLLAGEEIDFANRLQAYTSEGITSFSHQHNPSDTTDVCNFLLNANGTLIVAGSRYSAGQQRNIDILAFDYTVGVKEWMAPESVKIFPNPTSDLINIILPDNQKAATRIALYDQRGVLVVESYTHHTSASLWVANLPAGLYVLQLINFTFQTTEQVFIRH
jgi:uncharacterized delta-60 repeat protein